MLRFEGDRDFALPQAALFAKLSNARFLAECVPDVESSTVHGSERADLVVRPGFSFVRGTLKTTLTIAEAVDSERVRVELHSAGIGATADVEATLHLSPLESGTRAHW